MGNNVKLEYFPESRIALAREVTNHPDLMNLISKHKQEDFEIILAEIAAYCEIVLDATYTQEDINKLCDILWKKLRDKRTPIILLN